MQRLATLGRALLASASLLVIVGTSEVDAAMSQEKAHMQCRKELKGIGGGRGARERRFNMIEDCVQSQNCAVAPAVGVKRRT